MNVLCFLKQLKNKAVSDIYCIEVGKEIYVA